MKFILGKKIEMSQIFRDNGEVVPVTLVQAGPCVVTQVKDKDRDGYIAVQVGYGKSRNVKKPQKGHNKGLGEFSYSKEFRYDRKKEEVPENLKVGQKITVATFEAGDIINVIGTSKGKGFQGVVRRHGFHGSPATHGHKDQLRMPGSIGATGPAKVFKGKKMPGRMGGGQITVQNLEIAQVNEDSNILAIKGAVPGPRNGFLIISGKGELVIAEAKAADDAKKEEVAPEKQPEAKKEEPKKEDK